MANETSNLTERIKAIAGDAKEVAREPSLRDELEAFKNETSQQLDDLRNDLKQLLEAQHSGN